MSCEVERNVIHAYLDGELDALRAAEFERHLEKCAECVRELEAQETLKSSLQRAELYEKAPTSLRRAVVERVRPATPVVIKQRRATPQWTWLAAAAAFLLLAYAGWRVVPALRGESSETVIAAEVVDAHLRSLQPGHLTDVISTDQHTVKPWFNGKLDYSPPVRDFSTDGFPLQGGRLDVVHGRTVTALVYGRRKHLISVFIWPVGERDDATHSGAQQGYNWVSWQNGGMEFRAVSDVSATDLEALHQLYTH
jgi:mycothiol system anti-sigma-R factor